MTFTDGPEVLVGSSTMQVAPWLDVQWRIDHETEVVDGSTNATNGTQLQQQFHVEQVAPAKNETVVAATAGSTTSDAGATAAASDQEGPNLETKVPPLVNVDFDMGLCLCD